MLQINSTYIDAVIMDGLCAGPFCNASDWDFQRNTMAKSIFSQLYSSLNQSTTVKNYAGVDPRATFRDFLNKLSIGIPLCGVPNAATAYDQAITYTTYMLFEQPLRPAVFSSAYQLERCLPNDYGNGIRWYHYYNNPVSNYLFCRLGSDARFMSTHLIMSELIDFNASADFSQFTFHQKLQTYTTALKKAGWKTYPTSPYRTSVATYSKPMLMLNGDYDYQAPLSRATQFASFFNASAQTYVVMPGMSQDTISKSYIAGQSMSCGLQLVSQFINCPTCAIDTSCTNRMIGLTVDGDVVTKSLYGDVWASYLVDMDPVTIGMAIIWGVLLPLPIIVFIALLFLFKNRRVTARLFVPHIGQLYIFAHMLLNLINYAGKSSSLNYLVIGFTIQHVLLIVAATVILYQMVRFFMLKRMYHMMKAKSVTVVMRVYKLLTSKIPFAIAIVATFVVWSVFGVIMSALVYYYGFYPMYDPYDYSLLAFAAFFCVIATFMLIYDFIAYMIITKGDFKSYWFKDDPLLFRFDTLFVLPIIVFAILGNVPLGLVNGDIGVANTILTEASLVLMVFFFGGNIVIACLVDKIKAAKSYQPLQNGANTEEKVKNDEDHIIELLYDSATYETFSKYCETEFSLENVYSYKDIQALVNDLDTLSQQQRKERFDHVNEQYMSRSSPMELNVPAYVAKSFRAVIEAGEDAQIDRKKSLTQLLEVIMVNLLDTFSRFKTTAMYEKSMETLRVKKSMKEMTAL
jgi:hypothetical protein